MNWESCGNKIHPILRHVLFQHLCGLLGKPRGTLGSVVGHMAKTAAGMLTDRVVIA